jgi:hypothetical protein
VFCVTGPVLPGAGVGDVRKYFGKKVKNFGFRQRLKKRRQINKNRINKCNNSTVWNVYNKLESVKNKKWQIIERRGKAWGTTFVLGEAWKNGMTVIQTVDITLKKWK